MINIKIDSKNIKVQPGTTLIDALRETGIEVPSMCYMKGIDHFTSCMICMVKDAKSGKLFPSCSYMAEEGMEIITGDDEVLESRKMALDLLLSEHVGDCEAPCQITCPAHMDIPQMNRLLAEGRFDDALQIIKKDIALPAIFGRICPAPCEGACRRKGIDGAVSICLLKRYAGDHDLGKDVQFLPEILADNNKTVAIIGAGPAGLAAAYFIRLRGYDCTVYDRNELAGGSMRKEVDEQILPTEILDGEIDILKQMGIRFEMNHPLDYEGFKKLSVKADAIVIATGKGESGVSEWGIPMSQKGVEAGQNTFRIKDTNIFAVGSALRPAKLAIRTLGQGKEVAFSVDQFLGGEEVTGEPFMFNSRFGKLMSEEFDEYLKESVKDTRLEPADSFQGFSKDEVMKEAARCLHCDCRDLESCKLRIYSDEYGAVQKRFSSDNRKLVTKEMQHDMVIYEPSKCIKCGICVRLTSAHRESYGMTFIGRGFDVVVGVPFNESMKKGLEKIATEVAEACPTGAISRKS